MNKYINGVKITVSIVKGVYVIVARKPLTGCLLAEAGRCFGRPPSDQ